MADLGAARAGSGCIVIGQNANYAAKNIYLLKNLVKIMIYFIILDLNF
jgi:hypothetical protein